MNRSNDKKWIWFGSLLGVAYIFGIVKPPEVGIEVLSIFFSGLLAISAILPTIKEYVKIKNLYETGHMSDLVEYIKIPLALSFILIIIEFSRNILVVNNGLYKFIIETMLLTTWGIFLCSLLRIIRLVPLLLEDN